MLLPQEGTAPLPLEAGETLLGPETLAYGRAGHAGKKGAGKKPGRKAIEKLLKKAQKQVHSKYVAVYSVRKHKKRTYTYMVSPLSFSPQALKGGKGLPPRPFLFMVEADSLGTPRMAVAFIPQGEQAYQEMLAWILPHTPNAPGRVQARPSLVQGSTADGCDWVEIRAGTEVCAAPPSTGDPVINDDDWSCHIDSPPVFGLQCGPHDTRTDDPTMYNWPENGGGGGSSYPNDNGSDDSDDNQDPPPVCDPNSSINPVGCVYEDGAEADAWEAQQIDDLQLNPCMADEMADLKNLKTGVGQIIQKFAGKTLGFNWKVKDGNLAQFTNGKTSQQYDVSTGTVTTVFDASKFGQATNLAVARVILHEAVHAYVVATFYNSSTYEERKKLLGNNWTYPAFGDGGHGFMVDNFIKDISLAIQEFGENHGFNLSSQFYDDLAWGGLTHYKASDGNYVLAPWFKNQIQSNIERNRILNNIDIEQTGKDQNGNSQDQRGTRSGC